MRKLLPQFLLCGAVAFGGICQLFLIGRVHRAEKTIAVLVECTHGSQAAILQLQDIYFQAATNTPQQIIIEMKIPEISIPEGTPLPLRRIPSTQTVL